MHIVHAVTADFGPISGNFSGEDGGQLKRPCCTPAGPAWQQCLGRLGSGIAVSAC